MIEIYLLGYKSTIGGEEQLAGKGITTGKHTQLGGSVIASMADKDKRHLSSSGKIIIERCDNCKVAWPKGTK